MAVPSTRCRLFVMAYVFLLCGNLVLCFPLSSFSVSPISMQGELRQHSILTASELRRHYNRHEKSSFAASADNEERTHYQTKATNQPRIRFLGMLPSATLIGTLVASLITIKALQNQSTNTFTLFQQHVIGAVWGTLVCLPGAIRSITSRVEAIQQMPGHPSTARRQRIIRHVRAHLYLTYLVAGLGAFSLGSIFLHKQRMGRPHFTSLHSALGGLSFLLWTGAYLLAQFKTWRPNLKKKLQLWNWSPQLLWASKHHRLVGKLASILVWATTASGIFLTKWGKTSFSGVPSKAVLAAAIISIPGLLFLPKKQNDEKQ